MSEGLHPVASKLVDDWFITSAEEDYLVARWANQNGILHQYCWSAAQCIEKIVKAALLKRKLPTREGKTNGAHDLVALFELLMKSPMGCQIPATLDLHLPVEIISAQGIYSQFLEPTDTVKIISSISENGDPNSRYRATPRVRHARLEVHRLDALFLLLRTVAGRPLDNDKAVLKRITGKQELANLHFKDLFFYLQGSTEGLSKIITNQNLAFFPSCFSMEQPFESGFSMRSNSYPIRKYNAELFNENGEIEDLGWLMRNSRIPESVKTDLEKIAHEIRDRQSSRRSANSS